MKKSTLIVAALLAMTGSAAAADLIIPVTPVEPMPTGFDWSGFYAGINAGYGTGQANSVGNTNGLADSIAWSGAILGVNAGVNAQFDNYVLGLEGDVAWSGISGSTACSASPAVTCMGDLQWLGSVRGRAGLAFDTVLLYATGGLAFGSLHSEVSTAFPGSTGSSTNTALGWTAGAGVELAVTDSMSVKAEYSYTKLHATAAAGTIGTQSYDLTAHAHVAKIGLNVHF